MAFTAIKWNAPHRIEFGHVGDKVHLAYLDGWNAPNELGGNVKDGE